MLRLVTLAVSLVLGISHAVAKPVFSSGWSFPSCNTVSFRTTGISVSNIQGARLDRFCENLAFSHAPTILELRNSRQESGCSYKVTAFSGPNCRDDLVTNRWSFNWESPVIALNQQKAICSYRLKYSPWPYYVTVKVQASNGQVHSETHASAQRNRCSSLCGDNERNYPRFIGVFNHRGQVVKPEDNYLELFSGTQCQDDTQLIYPDGRSHVTSESNLERLTRDSSRSPVLSYRIERE